MPANTISPETRAKLKALAEHIVADPDHFDMSHWMVEDTFCGTVGCLAGTVCMQAGMKLRPATTSALSSYGIAYLVTRHGGEARVGSVAITPDGRVVEIAAEAARQLGLTEIQACSLFLPSHWPIRYRGEYQQAATAADYAEAACVTARRLRHFCDTGE